MKAALDALEDEIDRLEDHADALPKGPERDALLKRAKALDARKDKLGDETGIALVANATQLLAQGKQPGQEKVTTDPTKTPFYAALEEFVGNIRNRKKPSCGALEGYQAAVVAIKANEAIKAGSKLTFQPEWFNLSG